MLPQELRPYGSPVCVRHDLKLLVCLCSTSCSRMQHRLGALTGDDDFPAGGMHTPSATATA